MNCDYVRNAYGVPACIGRKVVHKGRAGIISADRGNYIGVTMMRSRELFLIFTRKPKGLNIWVWGRFAR